MKILLKWQKWKVHLISDDAILIQKTVYGVKNNGWKEHKE